VSEIVEELDSPDDVISRVCLTDREVTGIMEVRGTYIILRSRLGTVGRYMVWISMCLGGYPGW